MTTQLTSLAERVQLLLDETKIVKERLRVEGPRMINTMLEERSLRSIARESGLHPTYLSNVRNGHRFISPKAFIVLARIGQ